MEADKCTLVRRIYYVGFLAQPNNTIRAIAMLVSTSIGVQLQVRAHIQFGFPILTDKRKT